MQVSRELLERVRVDALGGSSCDKSENSLSVHRRGLGDVSPPRIVCARDERKRSPINLVFKSR